jgi:hypothetical protein
MDLEIIGMVGLFMQTLTMIAVFMNTAINIVYRRNQDAKSGK